MRTLLLLAAVAVLPAHATPTLHFVSSSANDVWNLLVYSSVMPPFPLRLDPDIDTALGEARVGDAIVVTNENYPNSGVTINYTHYDLIASKQLRCFIEMPIQLPGAANVTYSPSSEDYFHRIVVASNVMQQYGIPELQIMQAQGAYTLNIATNITQELISVFAVVAGVDSAIYGLPPLDSSTTPGLFAQSVQGWPILFSGTKFSNIVSSRYTPKPTWQAQWNFIISNLTAMDYTSFPDWDEEVHPALPKSEVIARGFALRQAAAELSTDATRRAAVNAHQELHDIETTAFAAATDFLAVSSGLLILDDNVTCPAPYASESDTIACVLEGWSSQMNWDGTQQVASTIRFDCVTESAMALALRAWTNYMNVTMPSSAMRSHDIVRKTDTPSTVAIGHHHQRDIKAKRTAETARMLEDTSTHSGSILTDRPSLTQRGNSPSHVIERTEPHLGLPPKALDYSLLNQPGVEGIVAPNYTYLASVLLEYLWEYSVGQGGQAANVSDPSFGFIAWFTSDTCTYGDDNARVLLGAALGHSILGRAPFNYDTSGWDAGLMKSILANLRVSSPTGYRPGRINYPMIPWQQIVEQNYVYDNMTWPQPHYQAEMWAVFLWAYVRTGFEPLYDVVVAGIPDMLQWYPNDWRWTEYLSEERCRLLLTLAWLLRADTVKYGAPVAQHVHWLEQIANDYLARQLPFGAVQPVFGNLSNCDFCPPQSNSEYGTNEAPVTQVNTDTVTDQLYDTNYALIALWEAYKATGNYTPYGQGADLLASYLTAIQAQSTTFPEVSGGWMRGFDYSLWTAWGSSSDIGWGPWSIETGWTTTWTAAGLGVRALNTSYWDLLTDSNSHGIDRNVFLAWCPLFFDIYTCNS